MTVASGTVAERVSALPVVSLDDVRVEYRSGGGVFGRRGTPILAVDGVSVDVHRGRSLGIVGATGSGKSTLAQLVMGMVEPTSGTVRIDGSPPRDVRGRVQIVMQDPYSSLDARMTVRDIIAEPLTLGRRQRGEEAARVDARVGELLALVGLPANRGGRYPHQFSGGQRQRIAIARALASDPSLVVLDEPTSALDVSIKAQILNLLRGLQESLGVTFLVVSHDLVTVGYLASEVIVMHRGQVVERGPTRDIFRSPRHPYTLELLASSPGSSGEFLTRPRPVDVTPESLPSTACRYAYRCTLRTSLGYPERCLDVPPALAPVGAEHVARCHFSDEVALLGMETVVAETSVGQAPFSSSST